MYIYIRARCPKPNDETATNVGHYDMIIDGTVDFKEFREDGSSYYIYRPVVSYGHAGVTITALNMSNEIFDMSESYIEDHDFYVWRLSVEDNKVPAFFTWLRGLANNVSFEELPTLDKISFRPNNEFATYDMETRNCFVATAKWLQQMGNDSLIAVVNAATYMRYSPWIIKRFYGGSWSPATY